MQKLFSHPTEHYDVLVSIDAAKAPRYMQNLAFDESIWRQNVRYANAVVTQEESQLPLLPGFDPVQLLYDDLKVSVHIETSVIAVQTFTGGIRGYIQDIL